MNQEEEFKKIISILQSEGWSVGGVFIKDNQPFIMEVIKQSKLLPTNSDEPIEKTAFTYRQGLFDLMHKEHGLTLLETELDEIISEVEKMSSPSVEGGAREYFTFEDDYSSAKTGLNYEEIIERMEQYSTSQMKKKVEEIREKMTLVTIEDGILNVCDRGYNSAIQDLNDVLTQLTK